MTARIHEYLNQHRPPTPCLIIDLEDVQAAYHRLTSAWPQADIYYALKANPAFEIIQSLGQSGACFDAASIGEIETCLKVGIAPGKISYGNTIKKSDDIARAHARGICLFAFDSPQELEKIATHAPGSSVFCRILLAPQHASWPVSDKFGCSPDMAVDLLQYAHDLGLTGLGVSFHVGSQQTRLEEWDKALEQIAHLLTALRERGLDLTVVNMGGGMPVAYTRNVPSIEAWCQSVRLSLNRYFAPPLPQILLEPGRFLVATAGIIESEVVAVTRKSPTAKKRWVYLDIGTNGGLIEAINHHICYPIEAVGNKTPCGPVTVAGPTCDWSDIIRREEVELPLDLKAGDRVRLLNVGAYTAPCATVGFNGFPPLRLHCL